MRTVNNRDGTTSARAAAWRPASNEPRRHANVHASACGSKCASHLLLPGRRAPPAPGPWGPRGTRLVQSARAPNRPPLREGRGLRAHALELPRRELRKGGQTAQEHPRLRQHRNSLKALRVSSQPKATLHEGVLVDQVVPPRDELEERPRVAEVEVQCRKVGPHLLVLHHGLELLHGDGSGAVGVHVPEELLDSRDVLPPVLHHRLCSQVRVAHGRLDGAVAEDAGDAVEDGERDDEDVRDEHRHEGCGHLLQGVRDLVPADAPRDGLEEREHRRPQGAPPPLEPGVRLRAGLLDVVHRDLGDDDGKDVDDDQEEDERPYQRPHGHHDAIDERPQGTDEADKPLDSQRLAHAHDAEDAQDPEVVHVVHRIQRRDDLDRKVDPRSEDDEEVKRVPRPVRAGEEALEALHPPAEDELAEEQQREERVEVVQRPGDALRGAGLELYLRADE
mmetsp:Transcript_104317/g.277541  ORF Transcript_104317/g.277541 Transcript_104317/m.277541 type:complete len:448 (-) Transcript_104317:814-2157(-)